MGQYYKAVTGQDFVSPWSYNNGAKLMEHSWVGNNYVNAVASLISIKGHKRGEWYGKPIVWAGDYADPESCCQHNLYDLADNVFYPSESKGLRYLKNLDTNEYIDLNKVPDRDGWRIHPLPLMTCEGNGRGGGDYRGESHLVGSWARHRVVMQKSRPKSGNEIIFNLLFE